MARRKTLSAPTLDFEDALATVISGGVELLTQASELSLALERVQLGLGNDGLRIPVLEGGHDCVILFIRVHRAGIWVVVVLDRGVGIESGLCRIISGQCVDFADRELTYFADELGSSSGTQPVACRTAVSGLRRHAWLP